MNADGLKDLFEPFDDVVIKRMFGGHGIYSEGLCFALEVADEVYLKSDAEVEPVYKKAGSAPFVYTGHGRPVTMSFWKLMPDAYDDSEELKRLSYLAVGAARRAAEAKAAKPRVIPPKVKTVKKTVRARTQRT